MKKFIYSITLLLINLSVYSQIPTDSLQLNYEFDGNCFDQSDNNLHGAVNGPTIASDRFINPNSSYYFNGLNDYIVVPDTSLIKPNFPFSISLWVKIDSLSSSSTVVYASDESVGIYSGFWIGYLSTGEISAGYGNGLGQSSANRVTKHSEIVVDTIVWHNIIASFNGINDIDLYVDCQKDLGYYSGSAFYMYNLGSNGVIGRSLGHNPNSYHKGKIDDIRFYNKSINDIEIDLLCSEPNPSLGLTFLPNEKKIRVYPNPASNNLTVDLGDLTGVNTAVKLYDSSSKLIFEKQSTSELVIDVSSYAKGVYTLELSTSDKVLRSQVVIE